MSNGINISNNEGYDNQPSFFEDDNVLYASTRNGQTDIAQYHINYKSKTFINYTKHIIQSYNHTLMLSYILR